MRLLADEQQRRGAVAPQAEVERHARQHRDDRVHHLGGEAGELHDGHRLAVRRNAEQVAHHLGHGVAADRGVLEHEAVARVIAERFDAVEQLVVDRRARAVLELAHPVVDDGDEVFDAVGHRRVDAVAGGLGVFLLG